MASLGLAALVLLSPALRQLAFQPPLPFSLSFSSYAGLVSIGTGEGIPSWKLMLFGLLLVVILVAIFLLLDPEQRKRLLLQLLRLTLIFGLAAWALTNLYNRGVLQSFLRGAPAGAENNPTAPIQPAGPAFIPPQVNQWLVFLVSFGVGLGLVLVGWYLYTHQRRQAGSTAMDEVAEIANQALNELQPGRNWDDAIVRAYVRMNDVVQTARHLERHPGSTPREFARRMEQMGLPGEAVRTLTNLFEGVRYGGKTSNPAERELAIAALNAIIHACGGRP